MVVSLRLYQVPDEKADVSVCKTGEQRGGGAIVVSEGVIKGGFGIEPAQRALTSLLSFFF